MTNPEFDDEQQREWNVFVDSHPRYVDTEDNLQKLLEYMSDHYLLFDRATLHYTYITPLDRRGLELLPYQEPIVVEEEASTPESEPPPAAPTPTAPQQRTPTIWRNGKVIPYAPPVPAKTFSSFNAASSAQKP